MHPTPDTSHLTSNEFEDVYPPAEDTFILLDALEADSERLRKLGPSIGIEIGSGSGCVSVFVQQLLRSIPPVHLCVDINPIALKATRVTFERNLLDWPNLIQASLVDCFRDDLRFELLLFNPPYVETEDEEYQDARTESKLAVSWAGGRQGMKLTDQLLDRLDRILDPQRGVLYLVAVKENKPEEIIERMQRIGFVATVVLKRRAGREHLHVLRISRPMAHTILIGDN